MFKYRGVNFTGTVYRPYPPLMASLFSLGFADQASWKKFIGLNYRLQDMIEIEGIFYYPDYHLETFARQAVEHIFKNERNFLHLKAETVRREKIVLLKNKKTALKDFFVDYLNYQPTLALYHICDDFIEAALRTELLKKVSPAEADWLMSSLNLPLKPNWDRLMKRWFLETGDVDGFMKKYSWYFSRYGRHQFLSRHEALVFLEALKKDRSLIGKDQNRSAARQAIKKAKNILKEKAYYVDVMQFFIYYRTRRTDILNKVFFSYYDQLLKFADNLGLTYSDFINCSYGELMSDRIPAARVLTARKEENVFCFSRGEIRIISGPELNGFRKLVGDKINRGVITGRTAFPGIVSGRVKIVKSNHDFNSFKKGDILVASMTTPNMIQIMKRAAAFVTDEGGITCHASILARELKKPCIIGTKMASKILKNGDRIKVDATRGTIKILDK